VRLQCQASLHPLKLNNRVRMADANNESFPATSRSMGKGIRDAVKLRFGQIVNLASRSSGINSIKRGRSQRLQLTIEIIPKNLIVRTEWNKDRPPYSLKSCSHGRAINSSDHRGITSSTGTSNSCSSMRSPD